MPPLRTQEIGIKNLQAVERFHVATRPTALFPISIALFNPRKRLLIWRIKPNTKEAVKARIGSRTGMGCQAMFHRIPMDVVTMFFQVIVTPDLVFPVTRLLNSLRPFSSLGCRGR
jgi:hypothetical protein